MHRLILLFAAVGSLAGCAIVENSFMYGDLKFLYENDYPEGTMSVSRSTHYGNTEYEKEYLAKAAESWCKVRGKVMVPISVRSLPAHGDQPSHTTFMFRAMDANDPTIGNPDVSPVLPTTTYFR